MAGRFAVESASGAMRAALLVTLGLSAAVACGEASSPDDMPADGGAGGAAADEACASLAAQWCAKFETCNSPLAMVDAFVDATRCEQIRSGQCRLYLAL